MRTHVMGELWSESCKSRVKSQVEKCDSRRHMTHACMEYLYLGTYIHIYAYTCLPTNMYTDMHIYMHIHFCMYICVCMYIHVDSSVYIHIYT